MNASDDRNVEAFKLQIEAATQMRSVIGANPLPNCLIIDEIDGAPAVSNTLFISWRFTELSSIWFRHLLTFS